MHRRTFATALFVSPFVSRLPGRAGLHPHAERRFVPARSSETFSSIQVEVQLAWTVREAKELRAREGHDPFDGLRGEFYISSSHPVELPDDLPGSITTYETVVGAAAVEGVVHIGGFRRGRFVWTVRVTDGPASYAIEAAEAIRGMELPDERRVRLAPSLLTRLLPVASDFSGDVEIEVP